MTTRKGTLPPMKKQSMRVKKATSLLLKILWKWSQTKRTCGQSINKCRKVSAARPQIHRETIQKPFGHKKSSIAKNLCNKCHRKKDTQGKICLLDNRKTLSLGLEQCTSSQADRKWKMPSGERSYWIKFGSPVEIWTNKICLKMEEGKTSCSLPLSQIVPRQ